MSEFFSQLRSIVSSSIFTSMDWKDMLDIALATILIYQLLRVMKNTKAFQVIKGFGILIAASAIASWLKLPTLSWLLSSVLTAGIVVVVVLFQPELRRMLEKLGRGKLLKDSEANVTDDVEELVKVAQSLSTRKVGALLVFSRKSNLSDIISTGTLLDSRISAALIENVFEPNTPLHDGAMILSGSRIVAAGCFLPLSENNRLDKTLGTRHRAALGISEQSDALVVVISEETGIISAAMGGTLQRYLDLNDLRELLGDLYASVGVKAFSLKDLTRKNRKGDETNEET